MAPRALCGVGGLDVSWVLPKGGLCDRLPPSLLLALSNRPDNRLGILCSLSPLPVPRHTPSPTCCPPYHLNTLTGGSQVADEQLQHSLTVKEATPAGRGHHATGLGLWGKGRVCRARARGGVRCGEEGALEWVGAHSLMKCCTSSRLRKVCCPWVTVRTRLSSCWQSLRVTASTLPGARGSGQRLVSLTPPPGHLSPIRVGNGGAPWGAGSPFC